MMSLFVGVLQRIAEPPQTREVPIEYVSTPGRGRLAGVAHSLAHDRMHPQHDSVDTQPRGPALLGVGCANAAQHLRRLQTIDESASGALAITPGRSDAPDGEQEPPTRRGELGDLLAVEDGYPNSPPSTKAAAVATAALTPAKRPSPSLGLLDALAKREEQIADDKKRARVAKETAAEAATDAKAATNQAAAGLNAAIKQQRPNAPPTMKRPAAAPGVVFMKEPTYSTEWSREQVLARTGRRGHGNSKSFKWGKGTEYATVAAAKSAAAKWCKEKADELRDS